MPGARSPSDNCRQFLRESPLGSWQQLSDNYGVKNVRYLAASALQAAHRVADGTMEVQQLAATRQAQHSGTQIADAGISALAHLACASTALASNGSSVLEARHGFSEAAKHLDNLRAMLTVCETRGLIGRMELVPLYHAIDETVGLVREAEASFEGPHSNAA